MVEELGAEGVSSPKGMNALAAGRFKPCSIFNDESKQRGWAGQLWQQSEMESLTLALQRELSSASPKDENNIMPVTAASGTGFNALPTPSSSSSSSSRHHDAVGSPVVSSVANTTRAISHLAAPDPSNGVYGIMGNDGRASQAPGGNKRHPLSAVSGGKVSKSRRSRASSKSPITFLAADPASFRAMVQQVTGVQFNPTATAARLWSPGDGMAVPLPKRDFSTLSSHNIRGLPTLDTSALRMSMCRDRILGSQQKLVFNSLQSAPIHEPLMSAEVASRAGELLAENLRSPCVQPWLKMGGSLPYPVPALDVDGWKEVMAFKGR